MLVLLFFCFLFFFESGILKSPAKSSSASPPPGMKLRNCKISQISHRQHICLQCPKMVRLVTTSPFRLHTICTMSNSKFFRLMNLGTQLPFLQWLQILYALLSWDILQRMMGNTVCLADEYNSNEEQLESNNLQDTYSFPCGGITLSGNHVNGDELSEDGRNPVNGEESCQNAPDQVHGCGPNTVNQLTLYQHPQGHI